MLSRPRRWIALTVLLAAASACTSGSPEPGPAAAPTSAPPTSAPTTSAAPAPIRSAGLAQRCGAPDVPSAVHRIRSTDGVTLAAATIGTGPRGLLLLHQSDGDSCGWWAFAGPWLAGQGYRVLMVDLRCFGESACPKDPQRLGERLADVRAAAAWLRRAGARTVAVAGVSMGGTIAVAAGADPAVGASAVADVSGELTDTVVLARPPLSARTAVPRLRVPLLYLTAEDDSGVDATGDTGRLDGAPAGLVTRTIVPGSGAHGWSLFTDDGRTPTRWAEQVAAFLRGR